MEWSRLRSLVGFIATALLVLAGYVVLAPFLVPIAWAAILAYATWPAYRWVRRGVGGRDLAAALATTLLVVLAVALPITLLSLAVADDVARVYRTLRAWSAEPPALPPSLAELPLVGSWLVSWHAALRANPAAVQQLFVERAAGWSQMILTTAGDIGRNLGRLGLTLLTLFFLYRHGEEVVEQAHRVVDRLAGDPVRRWFTLIGATVRGVCYGVLLTAVAQGLLASVGFWLFGVGGPALLGALTVVIALVPFGPPLLWAPVGLWVLATVSVWKGIALLVWGALVVSGVDNLLRPYFIGGATQTPFLLVFFGVLGGLGAFGLLGLFVGPAVLAVLLALWRESAALPLPEPGSSP